jgi:tetratricopeptide (TPR) repeat protein
VRQASPRRDPAVNPRLWIVAPFGNATKAADLDWLRDASVNLLSMDMGRWTDVAVVPDKRVGDFVRDLPAAKRNESLTLNDGLAMARRAGAAHLVMGDFFKLGKATRLVANVFDVATGARVRSITQEASDVDSLLTVFGPLSRGVLAVPPPPDAKTGDVGTKNLEAYRSYLLGAKALNRYELGNARTHLQRAMAIDSSFALAHLRYSLLLAWGDPPGGAGEPRRHALLAQQLGANLPKRDRMLIDARVASASEDFAKSCEISRALVAQDSTDIQALYMLGECSFHDSTVDPSPTDSLVGQFRSSYNTAIRSLTRVLELDPSFLGAFEHVFDILSAAQRGSSACPPGRPTGICPQWYSMILRDGDSLVTVPSRSDAPGGVFFAQQNRALAERPRVANLDRAQQLARRWTDADTGSEGARLALARVQVARGNLAAAESVFRRISMRASQENVQAIRFAMEVAAKRGRGAAARALFDSLVKAVPDNPNIDGLRGSMELMFGRMTRFDRAAAASRLGPEGAAYQREVARAILGVPGPELPRLEAEFFSALQRDPTCNRNCQFSRLTGSLAYSLHKPVGAWPGLDSAPSYDARLRPASGLFAGDTASIRRGARSNEANARANVAASLSEFGWSIVAVQAYLALADTASAQRALRFYVDTAMAFTSVGQNIVSGLGSMGGSGLWPRAMLLRADLAMATGLKDEARTWYLRVLDLWGNADAELKPTLDRIRAALVKLDTKA